MPYATLSDGCRIFFEVHGHACNYNEIPATTRPTLVVLHGGPGLDHSYEMKYMHEFDKFAQVIFIDHRGNGRSDPSTPDNWCLERWGKDVKEFCDVLGLEKPFIVGESFGGHVAMQYGCLYPQHAAGIILVDTEAFIDKEGALDKYEELGGREIRELARKCFEDPNDENLTAYYQRCLPYCTRKELDPNLFSHCIRKFDVATFYNQNELYQFDLRPQLARIKCPVLFLASRHNPIHLLKSAKQTAEAFGDNIEFYEFEEAGLVYVDEMTKASSMIEGFLQKHHNPC